MQAIVAVDENWAIGSGGQLLCPIRADLLRFKALTLGHPVILGRKTLATFPGGRPLPGRENLILSRDPGFTVEGARVFPSVPALLDHAPADSFVIGGQSVYAALLPHCHTVCLTRVRAAFPADAWFPALPVRDGWRVAEAQPPLTENGVTFQYITYRREGWA